MCTEAFSARERDIILNLVRERKSIIECQLTNRVSVNNSKRAWAEIHQIFNSHTFVKKKRCIQILTFYAVLKSKAKRIASARATLHKFGLWPPENIVSDVAERIDVSTDASDTVAGFNTTAEQEQDTNVDLSAAEQEQDTNVDFSAARQKQDANMDLSAAGQEQDTNMNLSAAGQKQDTSMDLSAAGQKKDTNMDLSTAGQEQDTNTDLSAAGQKEDANMDLSAAGQNQGTSMDLSAAGQKKDTNMDLSDAGQNQDTNMNLSAAGEEQHTDMKLSVINLIEPVPQIKIKVEPGENSREPPDMAVPCCTDVSFEVTRVPLTPTTNSVLKSIIERYRVMKECEKEKHKIELIRMRELHFLKKQEHTLKMRILQEKLQFWQSKNSNGQN